MKNILIPTDFSECARAAEEIGLEIAKKANAKISFLHTISPPIDWVKLPLEKEVNFPETKAEIGAAKSELSALVRNVHKLSLEADEFIAFNKGREAIDRHIENYSNDLVVMGSHGSKGFKELIASNTQKVVRYSPSPVLVIKEKKKLEEINSIVFASTFEEDVHESFSKVIEFADLIDAKIHLLYVNMPFHFKETDEIEERMTQFLNKCPRGTCTINVYNALNEERGILNFSKKINADLISVTTHGKTGFMRMLSPSITESLINHSSLPVLSVSFNGE